MRWLTVRARPATLPEDWSPIVEVFDRHGLENSLQEDSPPALTSCLVDVAGADEVLQRLVADLAELGVTDVDIEPLVEENWEENWKQFFKPRRIGRRIVVMPTWESVETGPDDVVLVLDPGQAFGTGEHPTTRMCLELLERVGVAGRRVADVGCGSGILAVAAVKLGAASVAAVDIDPIAVEVAKENAEINGVTFAAVAGEGIAALEGGPWDLVVSNIISATLIRISRDVAGTLPQGDWVVSGILEENWPDVLAAAQRVGFRLQERLEEDGWVAAWLAR